MKTGIGIYAKVTITIIMALIILSLIALNNPNNIFNKVVEPKTTVQNYQESSTGQMIQKRKKPTLKVEPEKIKAGVSCDLTDVNRFKIVSKNADNVTIPFSVIKIVKDDVELPVSNIIVPDRGVYEVTYKNSEIYNGVKREKTETYNFIAD